MNTLEHIAAILDGLPGDDGLIQCRHCEAWFERADQRHACADNEQ
jgi:hypothetical protein